MPSFKSWDQPSTGKVNVAKLYERGFAGVVHNPQADEQLRSEMLIAAGEDVCHRYGYADSSAGKLVAPWVGVEKSYPGCWPASAQKVGDCVVQSGRNAQLTTLVGEVLAGLPDEVTGNAETFPEVSTKAQKDGVLAVEPRYRYRGHKGHGWWCSGDVRVMIKDCGAVLRKNYDGHADLSRYNPKWESAKWKADQISAEERDAFDDNRFAESTEVNTFEACRDLLDRGFGITSCGSEGWSNQRDENGFSRRSGSWAHAMAIIGADDRPEVHRRYGGPLVLILNSWGPRWNRGGRTVLGTDLEIPDGSFWAKWSDVRRRSMLAISGLRGWERKSLPDYLGGWQ